MSLKKYTGGAWNDIQALKRNSGGAWAECEAAKRYGTGSWNEVWPTSKIKEVVMDTIEDSAVYPVSLYTTKDYVTFTKTITIANDRNYVTDRSSYDSINTMFYKDGYVFMLVIESGSSSNTKKISFKRKKVGAAAWEGSTRLLGYQGQEDWYVEGGLNNIRVSYDPVTKNFMAYMVNQKEDDYDGWGYSLYAVGFTGYEESITLYVSSSSGSFWYLFDTGNYSDDYVRDYGAATYGDIWYIGYYRYRSKNQFYKLTPGGSKKSVGGLFIKPGTLRKWNNNYVFIGATDSGYLQDPYLPYYCTKPSDTINPLSYHSEIYTSPYREISYVLFLEIVNNNLYLVAVSKNSNKIFTALAPSNCKGFTILAEHTPAAIYLNNLLKPMSSLYLGTDGKAYFFSLCTTGVTTFDIFSVSADFMSITLISSNATAGYASLHGGVSSL